MMHLGSRYKDVLSARVSCGTAAAQLKRGGAASHAHQATAKITEHTEHAPVTQKRYSGYRTALQPLQYYEYTRKHAL